MATFGTIVQMLLRSLETGSVYALAALAIIVIFRTSRVLHFAQSTMSMFSAYFVASMISILKLPLWSAFLLGVGVAVVAAFLVDFIIIRRVKNAASASKEIITFGLIMVFLGMVPVLFGVDPLQMPRALPQTQVNLFADASISYNSIFNIGIVILIMAALFYLLQKTKLGLAIRSTASNEPTARLMGVHTRNITLFAWILAGVLGLMSGVMIAPASVVTPTFMNPVQVSALFACVLGGFQTFYGPVLAAYIIAVANNFLLYFNSAWGTQIMYVLVLLFLVIRPNGLVGKRFVKKV